MSDGGWWMAKSGWWKTEDRGRRSDGGGRITDSGLQDWGEKYLQSLHNYDNAVKMQREMTDVLRFLEPAKGSFFLLGPRGTGKTRWTERRFPEALRVDLLDPVMQREMAARPERLRELVAGNPRSETVVIDEIQKCPGLLEVVHGLIESDRPQRFVLTGSSARKLRREGVNLLGGRAVSLSLYPFMAAELGGAFRLESALSHGLLPVVWASKDPWEQVKAYNALYLREEVQAEGLVRNVGGFARFLEAMSFSHGATLNLANISRECQISRSTVEGHLGILEDLLLGWRLPVFTRRAKRGMASHPKFYFFDTGIYRANRPTGPLDSPGDIDGAALEGLVAQHLRAWCAYSSDGHSLGFWQTRSGVEVDFVVYGAEGLFAVEVKNTGTVRPQDLRGLRAFGLDYPESRRFLLYRGKDRLEKNGVLCMPCEEFLRALSPGQWPDQVL
jgi:predicted AAA+ superfamily ATPase